jgi:hypothetical protein
MLRLIFITACTIISITNAASQTLNVKNFGARGDGKTDDTRSIQQAIDAAPAHQATTIYFPKGTYILAGYITTANYLENYFLKLHSNIHFKGEGANSVIKLGNHLFSSKQTQANGHLFYGIGINNVSFTNLQIDLNGPNNLVPEGVIKNNCAVFINHGRDIRFTNNTVKNAAGRNMLIILGTGSNIVIDKNNFLNGGHNAGGPAENIYQADFSFVYCEWDSARVTNNQIKQTNLEQALNSITGGIELHGSHSIAANNTITGCSPGIYVSSSWHAMENTVVENNQFINCPRGISFWMIQPMNNIRIKNNQVTLTHFRKWKNYTSHGIEMPNGNTTVFDGKHANGALISNLEITGNSFVAPPNSPDRTAGMVLHSLNNALISNNSFSGMNFGGVIIQGSKWGSSGITITKNKFAGFTTNYDVVSPAGYVVVFDSYVLTDKTAPGIKNIVVTNNDFLGQVKPTDTAVDKDAKKGRFTGAFIALPAAMHQQVKFSDNRFSQPAELVEYVKTGQ